MMSDNSLPQAFFLLGNMGGSRGVGEFFKILEENTPLLDRKCIWEPEFLIDFF